MSGGPPVRIGLDVGGTTVSAAAIDGEGAWRPLAEHSEPTVRGPEGVVSSVRAAYTALLDRIDPGARVVSVGIGVPGVVTDGSVSHAINLGIGAPLDLAGHARRLMPDGGAVAVENDVKAAVRGAARWLRDTGAGAGDDLALLNVGTGLAAGLILDGQVRRGSRGMAGEIGHLVSDPTGPRCACGKRGCLELYASGGGVARRWDSSAAALMAAAAAGDRLAAEVAHDLVAGLAQAVRTLVQTTDVADVVLTGGVVQATPALRAALVAELRDAHEDSAFERALGVHERLRWLPEDYPAGAVGAALLPVPEVIAWRS